MLRRLKPVGSKRSGRVLFLIKWTLSNKANLRIQRMLQLHEVVCHTLFKDGVHLQIFYNNLLSIRGDS